MTDIEINSNAKKISIKKIAKKLNLSDSDIILYGDDKAKIIKEKGTKKGKLILVTAISPTVYGEGKTTVSIGVGDALKKLNKNVVVTLRQPSMGPVFGLKGGATGGGYSQVVPMTDINLHFTGDFHAITSANNLLAAAIDNHIENGNKLDIQEVLFNRCLDINDRELREVNLKRRCEHFDITAASEVMALFCLADNLDDLEKRLGNIIIGKNSKDEFVYAKELKIEGALTVILKDAFYPNLVQTLENTPVIIHGGPFANIAHGCNSIRATKLSLSLADYVITEAGFGADLGAEKFFDIKCRSMEKNPDCIILVATIKALKYGGKDSLDKGVINLITHIKNLKLMNSNIVVCLNKFDGDKLEEIEFVKSICIKNNVLFSISTAYKDGGSGAIDLANNVLKLLENENKFNLLYKDNLSIKEKIEIISKKIYRASNVEYSEKSLSKIKLLEEKNLSYFPICIAKTQYSLSDDKKGDVTVFNHTVHVNDIKLYNGAGFITVFMGNILTMPGLSKNPNYEKISLSKDKEIVGIF